MKFLKGLALTLLGFLLFLSLSVFGLALTINQTILNPDFVVAEVNKLDISSLVGELISEQMPDTPITLEDEFTAEVIDDTITDMEPWIKEQTNTVIYSGYDYLMGRSQSLSLVISTEPLKEAIGDNLKSALLQSPPPELAGLPPAMIDAQFDQLYQQYAEQIPATFDLSEMISTEVMTNLEQVKQYIGYFQIGYKALIAFIIVLIAGIILIHRQVRGATRQLGITFLTYGIPAYVGILVIKHFAEAQMTQLMAQPDLPASLQTWLPQLFDDFLAPLEMFTLGALICGAVLLIISFVYKRREPSF
jgi:hypothetical protein